MHKNSSLIAITPVVYYLLIWIENDTANSQNNNDNNDVTGVYNGTVSMSAAGGRVVALFKLNENNNQEISTFVYTGITQDYYDDEYDSYTYDNGTPINPNSSIYENGQIRNEISYVYAYESPKLALAAFSETAESYNGDQTGVPFYLKHKLINNIVVESYLEFIVTNEMKANFPEMTIGIYTIDLNANNNINILNTAFGEQYCSNTNGTACITPDWNL